MNAFTAFEREIRFFLDANANASPFYVTNSVSKFLKVFKLDLLLEVNTVTFRSALNKCSVISK